MKVLLTALFGAALLHAGAPDAKSVHTIYVPLMHSYSGGDNLDYDALVRSKLISSLAQYCGSSCTVLEENPDDDADAVLTGSVFLQQVDQFHRRVQGSMRLVDKDGRVLWAATIYSSVFGKSPTSSFADRTAKKVVAFLSGKQDREN
jgi:hypothetical protein